MAEPSQQGGKPQGVYTESDVLARIETILRFTTAELLDAEKRAEAFRRLHEFEAHLLAQQRAISKALENLQQYRDRLEKDWDQEKQVRENMLDFTTQHIKELYQTLRAQELLLDYAAAEQKFLRNLLIELHEKKKLSEEDTQRILAAYDQLHIDRNRKSKK
ncbi:MAG: hypothetical protein N2Z22_03930 [Turneriella sp.]|nr:hypothetical protein [Turneriella sp.]